MNEYLVVYHFKTPDGWGDGNMHLNTEGDTLEYEDIEDVRDIVKDSLQEDDGYTLRGSIVITNIIPLPVDLTKSPSKQ